MKPLNEKQQKVLAFVKERLQDDIPPSVREICEATGIKSTSTVHAYLKRLEDEGYIDRRSGLNRAIRLPGESVTRVPLLGKVTAGQPIYTFPAGFTAVASRVGGFPLYTMIILLVVFLLGWYILRYTRIGRYTYAIGGNENCAKLSGINLKKVKCFVYTVSGLCCGVAALLLSSRLDSAVPTNAEGQEMDAIAAVVIGGTSMSGGEGSMIGTLIGILIIGIISNGLNLLGVQQGPQKMVKGLIIVVAVIIDVIRRKASESAK